MAAPALQQQQATGHAAPAGVQGMGAPASGAPRPPSHRRRFVIGVALGAIVAVGISYALLSRARADAVGAREQHKAIVSTLSLADLVVRAGGTGDGVRTAVAAWQQKAPAGTQARVVIFSGLSLEASTYPAEGAPRRLSHDEKPLYDQGQRIRTAVETNRDEGVARKEEMEISTEPNGAMKLAAPVELDGNVIGMVEVATAPAPAAPSPDATRALLALLGPVLLFGLLALAIGQRRAVLAAAALVTLAFAIGFYAWHSISVVTADRRAAQEEVANSIAAHADAAKGLISQLGLAQGAAIDAARWDSDVFRHPRGLVASDGRTDEARLSERLAAGAGDARRALFSVGLLGLLLMLAVGLGGVSRLASTFVEHRQAYAYIAPAMLAMLVLVFFPFFYGITLSFTDSTLYNTSKPLTELWVGLRNYVEILSDLSIRKTTADGGQVVNYFNFYWTLWITVIWTVTNVAISVTSGLILALILNTKNLALRPIYRVLLILPWAMPNYITSLIWKGMFHQQFGVVNHVIALFGGKPVSWFETPLTSFLTALTTNCWLGFPFMMVVSLGALQSIPGELYEAARVDGAGKWQQFKAITLPSLKPALIPAIILSVVWTFNQFNVIYLVTAGDPGGSTEILITQAFKFAFEKYRYGYAAAYSTVIFGILLIYGTFQNRITKATEGV